MEEAEAFRAADAGRGVETLAAHKLLIVEATRILKAADGVKSHLASLDPIGR